MLGRWLEGKYLYPTGVEVKGGGMVDEGPDVGAEELLGLILLHVLKLQVGELLQTARKGERVIARNTDSDS